MQRRGKVEEVSGQECINEMQGGQRIQKCVVKM